MYRDYKLKTRWLSSVVDTFHTRMLSNITVILLTHKTVHQIMENVKMQNRIPILEIVYLARL
jgi:aspartate/glutamate racemase